MSSIDGIPEDKLPQCWSDDIRMNALFAPFRLKQVNPESWDMKMKFWSEMLRQWCKYRKDPIITAAEVKFGFQRNGRMPACLEIVIEEMYRNGELSLCSKYRHILQNETESWVKWGARLAFKPATFAITAVKSLLPNKQMVHNDGLPKASIDSSQKFVLESSVQNEAEEFLKSYPLGIERIGEFEDLYKMSETTYSKELFEILLGWLVSQNYAAQKGDFFKLAEPDKKVTPITKTDEAIARLSQAEARLTCDADRMSTEIAGVENNARLSLRFGNKLAAKNFLVRKHRVAKRLEKCMATLENVRLLQSQLRDVEINKQIVDVYKSSTEAMKKTIKEGGLDVDDAQDTVDNLNIVMEDYREIESILSKTTEDFDSLELEQELNDLLAKSVPATGSTQIKENLNLKIPSPPKDTPSKEFENKFMFDGEERMLAELNKLDLEDDSPKDEMPKMKYKVPIASGGWTETAEKSKQKLNSVDKSNQAWSEPIVSSSDSVNMWGNNNPKTYKDYMENHELHLDNRLHPEKSKQKLNSVDETNQAWSEPIVSSSDSVNMWGNNNPKTYKDHMENHELYLDNRLHPGQPMDIDNNIIPSKLYTQDFLVKDHKFSKGVWFFNQRDPIQDDNCNVDSTTLSPSTSYYSPENPSTSHGYFQKAPGGERRKSEICSADDSSDEDM